MLAINEKLDSLHFEHKMWSNELSYYLKDMIRYEQYLIKRFGKPEADLPSSMAENIRQVRQLKEVVTNLMEVIKKHVLKVNNLANANGELTRMLNNTHPRVRKHIAVLRKDYSDWKGMIHKLLQDQV